MKKLKIIILAIFLSYSLSLTVSSITRIGCDSDDDDYYFSFVIDPAGIVDTDVSVSLSSPKNVIPDCEISDTNNTLVICEIDSELKNATITLSSVTYNGATVALTDTVDTGVTCNISFIKTSFAFVFFFFIIF